MQGRIETRVGIFVLAALGVFIYMGFQIGAFRFDRARYAQYTVYFTDISGLSRKADVKIAGVKVGWVEQVSLLTDYELKAEAKLMILKDYALYNDAYAIVRQEGLLGPKYIEVIPGDPLLHRIEPGGALGQPTKSAVSVDELLQQFKTIATNVSDITDSFKDAVGGPEGKEQLKAIFDNLQMTSERLSSFADVIDRSVNRNEDNFDTLLSIGNDIRRVSEKLERDVFPSFQTSVEKISNVFDRDITRIATKLESTAQALEEASIEARDGFRCINSVADKIDEGKGLIGKLVNEDDTYHDIKVAVHSFRDYLTKFNQLQVVFDSHFETMHRPAENYTFEDSKGYFDIRLHFSEDYFYMFQLVSSQKGYRFKKDTEYAYFDIQGNLVEPNSITIDNTFLLPFVRIEEDKFKRNQLLFGFQFGKIFNRIALRVGFFENSAGLGVDIDIPFNTDKFRWVTTLEVFDMSGWNRKNDRRPHVKWLNRMFFLRNLYFTFGADDFASKRNASAFIGAGLRFGDDDVKYLLSSISGMSSNFISA